MKSPALFISAALLFAPAAFAQEDSARPGSTSWTKPWISVN